jgi:hypothetical protein
MVNMAMNSWQRRSDDIIVFYRCNAQHPTLLTKEEELIPKSSRAWAPTSGYFRRIKGGKVQSESYSELIYQPVSSLQR